jgi:AcrR family transcriptional regulator
MEHPIPVPPRRRTVPRLTVSRPRDPELDTKIIEAATEEFHTVGYGAMSLGSIAVRADVRPGAVYTRFRDKRDVLRAILEHVSTLRAERLRTLPGDDPYENLLYATRETHNSVSWEHAFTIPALAIMGTEEADEVRDLIRDDMASNRQMGLLRPALEQAVAEGVLPDNVSASYAAAMILGAYFTFRLGVDSEHWPDDMPEKLLQTLGAKAPETSAN